MVFKITQNGIEDNTIDYAPLINASSTNNINFNSKRFTIKIQFSETYPLTNNNMFVINITNTEIQEYDSIISNIFTECEMFITHVYSINCNTCKLAIHSLDATPYTGLLEIVLYVMT
jgi:hypothetical protein